MQNIMRITDMEDKRAIGQLPGYFDEDEDYCCQASKAIFIWGVENNVLLDMYARTAPAPVECLNFVGNQFLQPHVKLPKQVPPRAFLEEIYKYVIMYLDYLEPDLFFHGLTEAILSDDKYHFQFVLNSDGKRCTLPIGDIDVYKRFPHFQYNYEWMLRNPGLEVPGEYYARPGELQQMWEHFKEHFDDSLDVKLIKYWKEYFGPYYDSVSHVALWSTLMWMISPYDDAALKWRCATIPIYEALQQWPEILLHYDQIYTPDTYERVNIPHSTCVICGDCLPCANIYHTEHDEFLYFCQAHRPRIYHPNGEVEYPEPESVYSNLIESGFECCNCEYEYCSLRNQTGIVAQKPKRGQGQILRHGVEKLAAERGMDLKQLMKSGSVPLLFQEF